MDGNAISSNEVRITLETRLGIEARVTVLGHVQRGGSPSAFDRYMVTKKNDHFVLMEKLFEAFACWSGSSELFVDRKRQCFGWS